MSTFLLVQTTENGERLLSTVPVQWVLEKGKQKSLYWPNTKNVEKHRRNPHSVPDFRTWTQTPCIILNRNVKSFQEGLALEKDLSGFSDTEEEENVQAIRTMKRMHPIRGTALNFNHQVEILQNVASKEVDPRALHLNSSRVPDVLPIYNIPQTGEYTTRNADSQIINIKDICPNEEVVTNEENLEYVDESNYEIGSAVIRIETNQNKIIGEIENLKITQTQIFNTMTSIMTQHAEIIKLLSTGGCKENNHVEENLFRFEAISSIEELTNWDTNLNDDLLMAKLTSHLAKICGTSGKRIGWDVSYKVIDHFITREVMNLMQWTKCSSKEKPALIMFSNIQKCFFNAILLADSKYTFEENQKFFKAVCKNSKRRLEEKQSKLGENRYIKKSKVDKGGPKTKNIITGETNNSINISMPVQMEPNDPKTNV